MFMCCYGNKEAWKSQEEKDRINFSISIRKDNTRSELEKERVSERESESYGYLSADFSILKFSIERTHKFIYFFLYL